MLWITLILGIVEGLTEFLPISSTGHLILTSAMLGFEGPRADLFTIFIQLGAILAVVWEYRVRLLGMVREARHSPAPRRFGLYLGLAFVPAAVIGLLVHDRMLVYLFSPFSVAMALIAGGVLILVIEALPLPVRTHRAEDVGWGQALGIGFAQCLALWPGFSRSAATILGGLTVGLDRRSATEFSFFLALPTMFAAALYKLYESRTILQASDASWLAVASGVSFVVALVSIRWLLRFVSSHSFRPFAWYRIVIGLVILLVLNRS